MEKFFIYIDNQKCSAHKGQTILDVAIKNDIYIPTLCFLKGINNNSSCRICVVEVEGQRGLVTSCSFVVSPDMKVYTNTERVIKNRKQTLSLLLSKHNKDCINCNKNMKCELQFLANKYDIQGQPQPSKVDNSSYCIVRDPSKCILCNRCVNVCKDIQGCSVIGLNNRGYDSIVGCAFDLPISDVKCVGCGQCVRVCPTGALSVRDDTKEVDKFLKSKKVVVAATAPSVRVALGEEFDMPYGTNVEGKMVAALKKLGFNKVFDVNFTADLTIMEEAAEFINRLKGGKLPMFTSCSPAWINFIEQRYPDLIDNISTCKSPQGMFGAVLKTYYAQQNGLKPEDIIFVSIMPCTAKKGEIQRPQDCSGVKDIDVVLTTRELATMIKKKDIDFVSLKDAEFDQPLGLGSGAGAIFGTSGGVMEAALRTAYETITKQKLPTIDFKQVRALSGVKKATIDIAGNKINVAVVSGLENVKNILEDVRAGKSPYQFVEVMSCPGGCVNGGGQPFVPSKVLNKQEVKNLRTKAIYEKDKNMDIRKSHENPFITKIYKEFLGKPNSKKAHELLHTHYHKQNKV